MTRLEHLAWSLQSLRQRVRELVAVELGRTLAQAVQDWVQDLARLPSGSVAAWRPAPSQARPNPSPPVSGRSIGPGLGLSLLLGLTLLGLGTGWSLVATLTELFVLLAPDTV